MHPVERGRGEQVGGYDGSAMGERVRIVCPPAPGILVCGGHEHACFLRGAHLTLQQIEVRGLGRRTRGENPIERLAQRLRAGQSRFTPPGGEAA
jgi:hypothetical protein